MEPLSCTDEELGAIKKKAAEEITAAQPLKKLCQHETKESPVIPNELKEEFF